jgi:predicted  nucleic acid-binding Zn-ribbon protein
MAQFNTEKKVQCKECGTIYHLDYGEKWTWCGRCGWDYCTVMPVEDGETHYVHPANYDEDGEMY